MCQSEFWKFVYCHRIKLYQNASLCSNSSTNVNAPLAYQEDLEEEEKHSLEPTKEQTSLNTKPSALIATSALSAASVASTSSAPQLSVSTQWLSRPAIEWSLYEWCGSKCFVNVNVNLKFGCSVEKAADRKLKRSKVCKNFRMNLDKNTTAWIWKPILNVNSNFQKSFLFCSPRLKTPQPVLPYYLVL